MSEGSLAGKVAIVSAAGQGVGRGVAIALAEHGGIDLLVNAADDQRLVRFMEIIDDDMLANFRTGAPGSVRSPTRSRYVTGTTLMLDGGNTALR